ncbi:acylphosphatase [Candidatus Daviesbacteria bacterium]|nr:acylphosphatase [Candidatus Daviesbacteria bacterium]
MEAEGNKEKLDQFLDWCKTGPTLAKVERIQISQGQLKNFTEFYIN